MNLPAVVYIEVKETGAFEDLLIIKLAVLLPALGPEQHVPVSVNDALLMLCHGPHVHAPHVLPAK